MQEARCNRRPGPRGSPTEALHTTRKSPACVDLTSVRFFRIARPPQRPLIDRKPRGLATPPKSRIPIGFDAQFRENFPPNPILAGSNAFCGRRIVEITRTVYLSRIFPKDPSRLPERSGIGRVWHTSHLSPDSTRRGEQTDSECSTVAHRQVARWSQGNTATGMANWREQTRTAKFPAYGISRCKLSTPL